MLFVFVVWATVIVEVRLTLFMNKLSFIKYKTRSNHIIHFCDVSNPILQENTSTKRTTSLKWSQGKSHNNDVRHVSCGDEEVTWRALWSC